MSKLRSSSAASLATTLAELPNLSREQLIELWLEHMERPPPKAASPSLLLRAVAYAVQEQHLGGLKGQELRSLLKIVQPAACTARATATATTAIAPSDKKVTAVDPLRAADDIQQDATALVGPRASSRPGIPLALRSGTRLVREWQGKSHTIDVRCDGFGWNGEVFRSLSAVARAITGARWSGNRFFRL